MGLDTARLLPAEEAQGGDRIAASWEDLALPEGADDLTEARAVVVRLMEGSSDGMMLSPMPEGVELLGLELRDRTRPARSLWARAGEDTLRGLFLRELKARYDAAPDEAAREQVVLAVRFGLAALEGRDLG